MKNHQLLKIGMLAFLSTMLFSSCAYSNQSKAAAQEKAQPLSRTINILFDNDGCPIGPLGGSEDPVSVDASVTFHGMFMDEFSAKEVVDKHPDFQIGFSPFHPLKSSKKGNVHFKANSSLPLGNLQEYRFTYTVFAKDCNPVDPVIIIEK